MISIASGTVGAFTMTGWKRRSSAPSFSMYVRYASSVFFFSSRRRHTRSKRDWSSDVCSSDLLERKKQRRLVRWHPEANEVRAPAVRGVVRGVLVQDQDRAIEDPREARVVTRRRPTPEELLALAFAWRVVKHVKSNAIAFTTADRTLALGGGQTSRVEPVRNARARAERLGISLSGSVVGSDAFFPFPDGLEEALEAGATAVIQPGGSTRDEEVIRAADARGAAMVFTGVRHFRH